MDRVLHKNQTKIIYFIEYKQNVFTIGFENNSKNDIKMKRQWAQRSIQGLKNFKSNLI